MMISTLALLAALAAAPPPAGPAHAAKSEPCSADLKAAQDARDLYKVRLEEETERADAQTYLTRLELGVTKQRLAAALAKCGPACAPVPASTPPPAR